MLPPKATSQRPLREFVAEPIPAHFTDLPDCYRIAWKKQQELRELRFKLALAEESTRGQSISEDNGKQFQRFAERVTSARQAVLDYKREPLERALFACGRAVISEIRSVNGLCDTLDALAFSIFAQHLAALGMTETQMRRAYSGSALSIKYASGRIGETELRTASGVEYWDADLLAMAGMVYFARDKRAVLNDLLSKATAERDAVNLATSPRKARQLAAA